MFRVVAQWTGFQGAPGFTNFFFGDPGTPSDAAASVVTGKVRAFFNSFGGNLPAGVTVTVNQTVAQIDPSTGALQAEFVAGGMSPVVGSGTGAFAAPSGACITWLTGTIAAGKRLRGRSFIVPLVGSAYQADGTLSADVIGQLSTASQALVTASPGGSLFGVWHRPVAGAGGLWGAAPGFKISDKVAILTSRRD